MASIPFGAAKCCRNFHVPQQWLSRTTAPQVHPDDRRRLDFVVYGATSDGVVAIVDGMHLECASSFARADSKFRWRSPARHGLSDVPEVHLLAAPLRVR